MECGFGAGDGPMHYLDDLTVGMRFESARYALDAERIKRFAGEFDPQCFHLDEEAAAESFFGGLAASGWHTAAVTMRLLVSGPLRIAGGLIGAGVELDWPRPTRPGDVLRVAGEIAEIRVSRSRPDRAVVVLAVTTLNQQDQIVQRMKAKVLAFRRPVEDAPAA